MPLFESAHNFTINNSIFSDSSDGHTSAFHLLQNQIAIGAMYDSDERFPPPRCYPGTRRTITKEILDWVADTDKVSRILWLHGPAGAGKSAVAQEVAQRLGSSGQLAASFFFARNAGTRNNHTRLFSTIAYQLAISIPLVRPMIEKAVKIDPSITQKAMVMQVHKLIANPFQSFKSSVDPMDMATKAIIINGLDECASEDKQFDIIQLIHDLLTQKHFTIPFIVCSRPEIWIQDAFTHLNLSFGELCHRMTFKDSAEADEDIRTYLRGTFNQIKSNRENYEIPSTWDSEWPTTEEVENLVKKSSGQFIYAATVMKYVADPSYDPIDRLENILHLPVCHATAFSELDQLYLYILSNINPDQRTFAVDVLSITLALNDIESEFTFRIISKVHILSLIHQLLPGERGLKSNIHRAFRACHSLINIPKPRDWKECISQYEHYADDIRFFHASFSDFLIDESRSKEFFIHIPSVHAKIAHLCLETLSMAPIHGNSGCKCYSWPYALSHWISHWARSSSDGNLLQQLKRFDFRKDWLDIIISNLTAEEQPHLLVDRSCFDIILNSDRLIKRSDLLLSELINSMHSVKHEITRIDPRSTEVFHRYENALASVFIEHLEVSPHIDDLLLVLGLCSLSPFRVVPAKFTEGLANVDNIGLNTLLGPVCSFISIQSYDVEPGIIFNPSQEEFRSFLLDPNLSRQYYFNSEKHATIGLHLLRMAPKLLPLSISTPRERITFLMCWINHWERITPTDELMDGLHNMKDPLYELLADEHYGVWADATRRRVVSWLLKVEAMRENRLDGRESVTWLSVVATILFRYMFSGLRYFHERN